MPSWMAALHRKFNDSQTHPNVRFFLARLITNRPTVFQPWAKAWLTPLVQLILGGGATGGASSGGVGIHYFVVDLLVTILSWSLVAIPDVSTQDCSLLFTFCSFVVCLLFACLFAFCLLFAVSFLFVFDSMPSLSLRTPTLLTGCCAS